MLVSVSLYCQWQTNKAPSDIFISDKENVAPVK